MVPTTLKKNWKALDKLTYLKEHRKTQDRSEINKEKTQRKKQENTRIHFFGGRPFQIIYTFHTRNLWINSLFKRIHEFIFIPNCRPFKNYIYISI